MNITEVVPMKPEPLIVTILFAIPLAGLKLEIVGACITVKEKELVAAPPRLVTVRVPVVTLLGTVAIISVLEKTVN